VTELPDYFEPSPSDREWFSDAKTGDRGWLVRRDGRQYVRLDRGENETLRPYQEHGWIPLKEVRPLTRMQLSQVAFEADRKLCFYLGLHNEARREWLSLSDEARIKWMAKGPAGGHPARVKLWRHVMGCLKEWSQQ
jgi:hypothetical protein